VDEAARERALEALAGLTSEAGVAAVLTAQAGVYPQIGLGRAAVRREFGDLEGALLAACELGLERAAPMFATPFREAPGWLAGVRAATAGMLMFLDAEPALARLLVVHSAGAGERIRARRAEVLAGLTAAVDLGKAETRRGVAAPALVIAEGVVGAVLAVTGNRLLDAQRGSMLDLYGSLLSIIVLPYLGPGPARRELAHRPRQPSSATAARVLRNPGGRALTYRSARVLAVIAEQPGASNREIAGAAGVVDQGQISKLLGRLREQGMLESGRERPGRGAPNSWRLTDAGRRALEGSAP
jgi:DNA-binding MarR family transcriptional regulator